MLSRVFELIKQNIDIVDVAKMCGIAVNRSNKAICPWHNEQTPSLSFYDHNQRFHCFGCGLDGDVIDLFSRMNNQSPIESVRKLNEIYRLGLDFDVPVSGEKTQKEIRERNRRQNQKQLFDVWENSSFKILSTYFHMLKDWKRDFAPINPNVPANPRFAEALCKLDYIEYILETVYICGSKETKTAFLLSHERMIRDIEQRLIRGGMHYAGRNGTGDFQTAPFRPVIHTGGQRHINAA